MKKYLFIACAAVVLVAVSSGISQAIIVTATPNPAKVGQTVTIKAVADFGATPDCQLRINYGDGSGWINLVPECGSTPCTRTVTHSYTTPGKYIIRVTHAVPPDCPTLPNPPDPATTTITIADPLSSGIDDLPSGIVGVKYTHQIEVSGGVPPKTFQRSSGSLPPGLALSSSGLISGIPKLGGTFRFQIRVTDSLGQTATYPCSLEVRDLTLTLRGLPPPATIGVQYRYQIQVSGGGVSPKTFQRSSGSLPPGLALSSSGLISGIPTRIGTYPFKAKVTLTREPLVSPTELELVITVHKAAVSVRVNPQSFQMVRGAGLTRTLSYSFSSTASINTTLQSTNAEFRTNPKVGDIAKPLTVQIQNGRGQATETISIPPAVSRKAEKLGFARVIYTRTFTSPIVEPLTARVTISFTRGAGSELWISRISIYFENKRPRLTIQRNGKVGTAYADIRYEGTGLLKAYWEVDGRVLSRVQKHLTHGRQHTFTTPAMPPIPTFSEGSHRLRFIITEPEQAIAFPVAIYYVTAAEAVTKHEIMLLVPEDGAECNYGPVQFTWKGTEQDVVYLIEFQKQGEEKPFFSAYSRNDTYILPSSVLKEQFIPGSSYVWRVKGFDTENTLIGESTEYIFTFLEQASYVPGQLLLVAQDTQKGRLRLEAIGRKYNLRAVEEYNLNTLHLHVAVFYTEEEITTLMDAIMKEEGIVAVQPNYISRTLAEPMSDMQNMFRVLRLEKMHEQYKGQGIPVAVIDTGVDVAHRDLKDRMREYHNFIKDSSYKAEIHGTAVAGIIGASINGFGIEGVAPEADIFAFRACRQVSEDKPEGECYTTSFSQALDMAIGKEAKVVNMSLGAAAPDSLIVALLKEGRKRGIIFVAPVGNQVHKKELSFPASHPAVVAVCGIDDKGDPYPNREIALKARVCAPATNVFTTVPGDRHNFLSGTSMSSAAVAGLLTVAYAKDGGVDIGKLPAFQNDFRQWQEDLLKIIICEK
jgi:hypothetical protein